MSLWSGALAAGVPDTVFWDRTPRETLALIEAVNEREGVAERRADLRAGLIAAVVVNSNPYRKKGAKAAQPEDFFRERQEQTPAQMEAVLDAIMAEHNAKVRAQRAAV